MSYTDIDKSSDFFETLLSTGDGGSQTFTGLDFQPDWVWSKRRQTHVHQLYDSVRTAGSGKALQSDATAAEGGDGGTYGYLSSFTSDGFASTAGSSNNNYFNASGGTYVFWNWKAGTALNNSAGANGGSIATTGSISSTSGFGIVKYVGTGSNATIYHGLGKIPRMIITKNIDQSFHWSVYTFNSNTKILRLNGTNGEATETAFQSTHPTTTIQSLGDHNQNNGSGDTHISYMFCDVPGYQKIGSYTGNGNADGPFCFTGFKPAFVLGKRTDSAGGWWILDSKRPGFNLTDEYLLADSNQAEADDGSFASDFLSNGWKARATNGNFNASGGTYIYIACASNPFVTSTGIPATAR